VRTAPAECKPPARGYLPGLAGLLAARRRPAHPPRRGRHTARSASSGRRSASCPRPVEDHPTVEQDADHVAAKPAHELNPGHSRCPRLRHSVESLHRRASTRHSLEVCGSGSEPGGSYSLVGRVPTSLCPTTGSTRLCVRSGAECGVCLIQSDDADDRGNFRRSTRLGLLKCVERGGRLEGLLGDEGNRKLEKVARAADTGCSRAACRVAAEAGIAAGVSIGDSTLVRRPAAAVLRRRVTAFAPPTTRATVGRVV